MEHKISKEFFFDDIRHILPEIIGSLESGVVVVGQNHCIDLINSAALNILDIIDEDADKFIDINISEFSLHLKSVADKYKQLISNNRHKNFSEHLHIPPNKYIKVRVEKKLNWTLFLLDDVTSSKGLIHEATHDYLTQLYNRRYFESQLEQSLTRSKVAQKYDYIAFIDLNGFKIVNDLAGYMSGDQVLKKVADTILAYVEQDDCAARIGGDEFAILFREREVENVISLLKNIQKRVNEIEVVHAKKSMRIDFSCGITEVNAEFFAGTDHALAAAIQACGISKGSSTQHISLLKGKELDNRAVISDSNVINLLANAFESDRFSLFAQKIDGGYVDGTVTLEVLLRLTDENEQYIPPSVFIPIAERSNMMSDIDRWVVSQAFGLLEDNFNFFINISGRSLCDPKVCKHILREAKRRKIPPGRVVFEITETSTISELDLAREHMLLLKSAGFEFALDDFGTGFSSLLYLKHLPIKIIKIDGQFVNEMHYDELSLSMVNMISGMASDLGLRTVAEHVHCKEIYDLLVESDIDFLQGFYIHHPESLNEIVGSCS